MKIGSKNTNPGKNNNFSSPDPEKKPRNQRALLSMLLNANPFPVLVFDAALRCTEWNPAMEQITGITRTRAIGSITYEICPFFTNHDTVKVLEHVLKGKSINIPARQYRLTSAGKEQPDFSYTLEAEPTYNDSGIISGGILIARPQEIVVPANDKQENVLLLAEAEILAGFGIWEWETVTGKIKWSDNLYRIHGMEPQEVEISLDVFLKFVYPHDLSVVKDLIDKLQEEKGPVSYEHRILRKDGSIRLISGRSKPYFNALGQLVKITGCTVDITERKEAERLLKHEKEFSEGIINNSTFGISTFDNEFRYTSWNTYMEQLTSIGRTRALGKTVWQIFPRLKNKHNLQLFHEVLRGKKVFLQEMVSEDKKQFFEVNMVPLRCGNAEIQGGLIVVTDITERKAAELKLKQKNQELHLAVAELKKNISERAEVEKQLRESEERFRLLAENSTDMISRHDADGNYLYASPASKALFGYEPHELTGHSAYDFIHPEDLKKINETHENLISENGIQTAVYRLKCKSGNYTWVESTARIIKDKNKIIELHVATRNINLRKKAEDNLMLKNQELAQSNMELERFAMVISHDLKEPLRMITNYTQLLARKYESHLDTQAQEFIKYAVGGVQRIQLVINDLIEYSDLSMQKLEFAPTQISQVLESVIRDLKEKINETNAKISWSGLPEIKCNRKQFRRLLYNLLDNSIKFRSDKPPRIYISAEKVKKEWVFKVKDNGIGINKTYVNKIFVIFQRLHDRNAYEGTGIGLAICKKILDMHHGNISFESEPGEGTTFIFTLPEEIID